MAKSDLDALLERARNQPSRPVDRALEQLSPTDRDKLHAAIVAKLPTDPGKPTRWEYVGAEIAKILCALTGTDSIDRRDVEDYRRRNA